MKRLLLALALLVLFTGCGERTAEGIDSLMKQGVFDGTIPVETLILEPQDFEESFESAGIIEAEEDVTVSAEISGRILKIHHKIGDRVKKGSWLVSLDQSRIAARIKKIEAQLAKAHTQHEWAIKDLARQERLFSQQIAAERAFDEASRLVDTSRDEVTAAEADLELERVDLSRSIIKSPIDGIVARRHVSPGEYVREGTHLFDVVATDRVKFVFSVAERDITALHQNDFLEVQIDAHAPKRFEGLVTAIAPAGNQLTRTFRIEVEILNTPETPILPGMSGRTRVVRQRFANVFLLPEEAVLRDEAGDYVFLANDQHARKTPVEIISHVGDRAVISTDLGNEWAVIILGQSAVSAGTPIRVRRRHDNIPHLNFD